MNQPRPGAAGPRAAALYRWSPGQAVSRQSGLCLPTAEFTPKTVETPDLRTDLVYRLRIIVTDADDALRQGMPVTVKFTTGNDMNDAVIQLNNLVNASREWINPPSRR
jgi:hypothetical protein